MSMFMMEMLMAAKRRENISDGGGEEFNWLNFEVFANVWGFSFDTFLPQAGEQHHPVGQSAMCSWRLTSRFRINSSIWGLFTNDDIADGGV